jgi:hypothetical protein
VRRDHRSFSARNTDEDRYGIPAYSALGADAGFTRALYDPQALEKERNRLLRRRPKNYVRSDECVRELICERLQADPALESHEVSVSVAQGRVALEGFVTQRRMRYFIENVAAAFAEHIDNRIQVRSR